MDVIEYNNALQQIFDKLRKNDADHYIFRYDNIGKISIPNSMYVSMHFPEIPVNIVSVLASYKSDLIKQLIDILAQDNDLNNTYIMTNKTLFKWLLSDFNMNNNYWLPIFENHTFKEVTLQIKETTFVNETGGEGCLTLGLDILLYMIDHGYIVKESDFEDEFLLAEEENKRPLYTLDELKQHLYDYQANVNGQYVLK
jgi:hypothetical protein